MIDLLDGWDEGEKKKKGPRLENNQNLKPNRSKAKCAGTKQTTAGYDCAEGMGGAREREREGGEGRRGRGGMGGSSADKKVRRRVSCCGKAQSPNITKCSPLFNQQQLAGNIKKKKM
ncbi:uncharacterized protein PGTG_18716 [Puccinia graminis f. sp. tritici CRL 75-36-700-3]|uniref:Uncharacterized protein n=1 Tax=Puccinia graminis f. sp. tritici (strain CRL 75-36-700-3 / race SCCL) TaxID=418459 RepID=E3L7Q9_PUCGT|nr:uncharacterized protein PGTG_18716 [Puccinia graminis f. sp. tritici CRL 75-36-700-3]EFP92584.1 hypothetical protein PGTG_18716 [Puccinia graminis f. sp. tritici CRL 75-36-700-3]